jgi:tripartite motif-containing protein 71
MERDDLRRADALNSFWDQLALGRAPMSSHTVDDETADLLGRLQALGDPPELDSARERVWRDLQQHARWKEPDMSTSAFSLNSHGALPASNSPGWPLPRPLSLPARGRQFDPRWALAQAASAALLVATMVIAFFSVFHQDERPVVVPAVGTPVPTEISPNDWPMYRGNAARTGAMAGPGPVGAPVELWRFQTQGPAYRSPAVVGDVIYAGSGDGFLYALDRESGAVLWRYQADSAVEITPTVIGDSVYVVSLNGTLAALDKANGAERWRFAQPVAPDSTPLIVDTVLYVGSEDGNLYAIDPATGTEQWRVAVSGGITRSLAAADGAIYAGTEAGQLHALDIAVGAERWVFVPENAGESRIGTPTIANGMVYANHAGITYALDAASGAEQWRASFEASSPIAAANGMIFAGGGERDVVALDAATGTVRWRFATADRIQAAPAVVDEVVYVASFDRWVYALNAATGTERWAFAADGDMDYGPSVADGVVYVSTNAGTIYAIGGAGKDQLSAPVVAETTPQATPAPQAATVPVELLWQSTGASEASLTMPSDSTVAPDGSIWVIELGANRFQILEPDGTFRETWGEGGDGPGQFAFAASDSPDGSFVFDADGNLYVGDTHNVRIQKFDADRQFVTEWGTLGRGNGQFIHIGGMAIDGDGNLVVCDRDRRDCQFFDGDGAHLATFANPIGGDASFREPGLMTSDQEGNVYVADYGHNQVWKLAPGGELLMTVGEPGAGPGQFDEANDVAVAPGGTIYVADAYNGRIQAFASDGRYLGKWNGTGTDPGAFDVPSGVAVDAEGNVYVTDIAQGRVAKFEVPALASAAPASTAPVEFLWRTTGGPEPLTFSDALIVAPNGNLWVSDSSRNQFQIFAPDGTWLESWGEGGAGDGQFDFRRRNGDALADLAFAPDGSFYVSDAHNYRIQQFDADRNFVRAWGSFGSGDGQFIEPFAVDLDAAGIVYVVDDVRNDVQVFDPEGNFLFTFGSQGSGEGELDFPGYGSFDSDGNLWIANYNNHRVQQFAPDGTFLRSIGTLGDGPGEFDHPAAVAIDDAGHLFVSDKDNGRIQVFTPDGEFLAAWTGDDAGGTTFASMGGIALDGKGNVYIHDYSDAEGYEAVQKFRLLPPLGPKVMATPVA